MFGPDGAIFFDNWNRMQMALCAGLLVAYAVTQAMRALRPDDGGSWGSKADIEPTGREVCLDQGGLWLAFGAGCVRFLTRRSLANARFWKLLGRGSLEGGTCDGGSL